MALSPDIWDIELDALKLPGKKASRVRNRISCDHKGKTSPTVA